MKIPKRISDILAQKQDFIDLNRDKLEKSVIKLQSKLLDKITTEIVPSLDVVDGQIVESTKNYRILKDLDNVYKDFNKICSLTIGSQVAATTAGIIDIGKKYFSLVLNESQLKRFDKVLTITTKLMNSRVGLEGGQIVSGGFLESIIKDNTLGNQIKNYVSKSITGQVDQKDFLKGLSKMVNGDESPGGLEKQYQRYGYDLYQQYDRAYNTALADEFEMKYFLYQGGLIEDSRDFCVCHNNKVWTREEAADWDTWKPYMGEYPEGYQIKQKDIYEIPSYLGYPGYQPLVDFGGYRCRHGIGWISEELAFDLRPELKGTQ